MKAMKLVNVAEYANEYVNDDAFSEYAQHAFYSRTFDTELAFELMLRSASRQNVLLTNVDSFDYDEFFYQAYLDTEKGLS